MKLLKGIGIVVGLLVMLSFAENALAGNDKTFPATICQYWDSPDNLPRSNFAVSQFGRIVNKGNQRLGVVCPLLRDQMLQGIEQLTVLGINRNCIATAAGQSCPGLPTRCTFRVMGLTGHFIRSATERTLVRLDDGSSEALEGANFGGISVPDLPGGSSIFDGSTFVLFCEIGPDAELSSIYLQEK